MKFLLNLVSKLKTTTTKYPITRGMLAYSFIWPTSALIQQHFIGNSGQSDETWKKCLRFSLFGTFFVAPTLYAWIRVSTTMWPYTNLRSAVTKAIVEQISYTPAAMTCFYFFMTLLEGRTLNDAATEVQTKFLPTYKVAVCVWPIVATINFSVIPERNRVPFISVCSLIWGCFLAYMKHNHVNEDVVNK